MKINVSTVKPKSPGFGKRFILYADENMEASAAVSSLSALSVIIVGLLVASSDFLTPIVLVPTVVCALFAGAASVVFLGDFIEWRNKSGPSQQRTKVPAPVVPSPTVNDPVVSKEVVTQVSAPTSQKPVTPAPASRASSTVLPSQVASPPASKGPPGIPSTLPEQAAAIMRPTTTVDLSRYNLPVNNAHKAVFAKVKISGSNGRMTQAIMIGISADLNGDGRQAIMDIGNQLEGLGYKIEPVRTKDGKLVEVSHSHATNGRTESYQLTVSGDPKQLQALIKALNPPEPTEGSLSQRGPVKYAGKLEITR
jgi:hypothetical protein